MKKIFFGIIFIFFISFLSFAYNPPVGGDQQEKLSSASALTSASSSAGGAIFFAEPHSVQVNPALTAYEQRVAADVGFSFLASGSKNEFGGAFQLGALFPTKYFVGSTELRGIFSPIHSMNTGNTLDAIFGASKDITDKLSVGVSLGAGAFWGASEDWRLGAGLGVFYRIPYAGFLQDLRIGVSVLDLGKNYTETTLNGIDKDSRADMFPGIATFRTGAAATLFKNDALELGASVDFALPAFQNFLIDLGLQLYFAQGIYVSIAENINVREAATGHADFFPAIGIGYRFVLNSRKSQYMASRGWQESEMRAGASWKYLYSDINAFAGNATLKFGMIDKDAPEVELWN